MDPSSRRHFLATSAMGIGSVALSWVLRQDELRAQDKPPLEPVSYDVKPKRPHRKARAKAMISLFMQGGPSHLDMFDPKPVLDKHDGTKFKGDIKYDNAAEASAVLMASPWKFRKHGKCGTAVSEILPHFSQIVDDVCLIRSMHTGVNNHGQSIQALNTGRTTAGRPVVGSWLTYGLGTENQNLPAYVVLADPSQVPVLGVQNWSNGWLPSLYQGTVVRAREPRILNLDPPEHLRGAAQDRFLTYLDGLNRQHLVNHPGEHDLQARISGYELAAALQTTAKEALDISKESEETRRLYGIHEKETKDFGTRCLIARRLVERGVRFIQIYTRNQYWDHHGNIVSSLPKACQTIDRPSAALVTDLKRRGLLDSTLVQWGGEMGRLPVIQDRGKKAKIGRDHNTYGFSMWMAGGGIKGGVAYGETDEFGHKAVKNVVTHNDYHATLLHLFGLDPEILTFKRNAIKRSLIDGQKARVVTDILA